MSKSILVKNMKNECCKDCVYIDKNTTQSPCKDCVHHDCNSDVYVSYLTTKTIDTELRAASNMSAFTFYLDDLTKLEVLKKLKTLGVDQKKGSLSATIRVLLREFANNNTEIDTAKIEAEYLFTTTKNKRSTL